MGGELFRQNDAWQRQQRDRFLVPFYRESFSGFMLLDGDSPFVVEQQMRGRDTLVIDGPRGLRSVEEKIVRWKGTVYDAICCEMRQCGKDGFITEGWMFTCQADILVYCFHTEHDTLDCLCIDFPRFRRWFFSNLTSFHLETVPETLAGVRLVPIEKLQPFLLKRFERKAEATS